MTQLESGRYWAKSGLYVKAGVTFVISVKEGPVSGKTTIGWGNVDGESDVFAGGPCPGEGWLAFVGGYTVDAPQCLTMLVAAEADGEQEATVGIGEQC